MLSHFGLPPLQLFPLEQFSSPKSMDLPAPIDQEVQMQLSVLSPKHSQRLTVQKILPLLVNLHFGRLPRLKQIFAILSSGFLAQVSLWFCLQYR